MIQILHQVLWLRALRARAANFLENFRNFPDGARSEARDDKTKINLIGEYDWTKYLLNAVSELPSREVLEYFKLIKCGIEMRYS